MELRARVTLFGEGCRGSCSESLMKKFNLREGKDPQTYGLGIKEVWQIPEVSSPRVLVRFPHENPALLRRKSANPA
jgi:flavin-dependent dehydrogenase